MAVMRLPDWSHHLTQFYHNHKRLLPVCEAEILRVTVKELKFSHLFLLISGDFRIKVPKIAKKGT